MKNPFRWWLRSAEYRHLKVELVQVQDDLLKCMKIVETLNARERQRSRKQIEQSVADDPATAPPAVVQLVPSATERESPEVDRQALRQRAKARGMM